MTSSFRGSPPLPWDWWYISANPSITITDILENPDNDWDWENLSRNPLMLKEEELVKGAR